MKRSFTTTNEEETITLKRARKYLGSPEDERCVVASPFFASTGQKTIDMTVSESVTRVSDRDVVESDMRMEVEGSHDLDGDETESQIDITRGKGEGIREEMSDDPIEQRQVSESPPQKKPFTPVNEHQNNEIIPSSPITVRPCLLQFLHNPTSPPLTPQSPQTVLPPSSTSSRPVLLPVPSQRTATPILRPGMKKAYTPRPSHVKFRDTPIRSPALSAQQAHVVSDWKERFLRSEPGTTTSYVPRLTNTISARPMTPLHTPLKRNNLGPC